MFITDKITGEVYEFDPHQADALEHLYEHPRAGLFYEMSLSKTITALLYLYDMTYHEAAIVNTLVIAPDKVARLTWPDEINKWAEIEGFRYSIITGTAKQRLAALNADAEIYFIGVKNVTWLINQYLTQAISKNTGLPYGPWRGSLPFDCLVIDESSLFKSWKSQVYKNLRRALDHSEIDYRILLTGTPSPNGEIDLWSQINLLDDGTRLLPTVGAFIDKYIDTRGNGMIIHEYRTKKGAAQVIAKKIADIVLSRQIINTDIKIPDLVIDDIELELDEFDREVYEELEREYVLDFSESESVTVKTPADLVNKLLQVSSGAVYADKEAEKAKTWHQLNTLKIDALEELVNKYDKENFLVIYGFQHEWERIKQRFQHAVKLPTGAKLKQTFDAWNRGEIKMLVLHPASGGHGLNLQFGGRRMVWMSPTWNLEHWLQTLARLRRRGGLRIVFAHRLIAIGTRDAHVKKRTEFKGRNQDFLMGEVNRLKKKHL